MAEMPAIIVPMTQADGARPPLSGNHYGLQRRCGARGAKAVSRIRQSSKAGQPDTSGAMRDLLAAEPLRKSQIKGNEVWETVSGRARHRLPSCYPPNPREDNRPGGGVPERASVPRIRALLPLDFVLGESKVENPSIN